ncbi:MAG: hypothetical protein ACI8R9_002187 [Paraglaciecola sp.]|jgi:hypothetical protein
MSEYEMTSLDWLDNHLDLFIPPLDEALFDHKLLQRTGELAILYRALYKSGLGSIDMLQRWKTHFTAYIESEELAETARKNLGSAWAWLMPYFIFKDIHGITIETHEKTMEFVKESGFPNVSEVVPYRNMDRHYFLAMNYCSVFDAENLIENTSLSSCLNLLTINRETAYSITHSFFYVSDFGLKTLKLNHNSNQKCVAIIESLLAESARNADWDLLGEMIILGICTEGVEPELLSAYLTLFKKQQNPLGFFPPSAATNAVLTADMERDKIFDACYHTTLVSALVDVSYFIQEKESIVTFNVQKLSCLDENKLLVMLVSARNNAVEYLNATSASGASVVPIEWPATSLHSNESSVDYLSGVLDTREVLLPKLGYESTISLQISRQACSLAECFARSGDIELVLKLIGTCLGSTHLSPRWAAILSFVLQTQKPDGSIGYFLQEARKLKADNLLAIRIGLTDTFVQALDMWLDKKLNQVA